MKQHTKSRRPFDPATRACLLYAGSQAESRCSAIRKFKTDVNGCPLRWNRTGRYKTKIARLLQPFAPVLLLPVSPCARWQIL